MSRHPLMCSEGLKRVPGVGALAVTMAATLCLWYTVAGGAPVPQAAPSGTGRTYSTTFPLTEEPISEGGNWINGRNDGRAWTDVRTTPGFACGTEIGGSRAAPQKYDDSTALLTGDWGPDQTVEATVRAVNPQNDKIYEEVELRLRSTLSAHWATGIEVCFRCSKTGKAYTDVVGWHGPLGQFSYIKTATGSDYGVGNGDIVKATIIGNVITVYINGVQKLQATVPGTSRNGSPGMGFYLEGATGVNGDYGFTSFSASSD